MTDSKQLPLKELFLKAANAKQKMQEGMSLPSAIDYCALGLPERSRSALQSIMYDVARKQAFAAAISKRFLENSPPLMVSSLIETALILLINQRYSDFTIVNEAVSAARANRRTLRFCGLVNAVLRRFLRERAELTNELEVDPEIRFNVPQWWLDRVRRAYPDSWEQILSVGTLHAPLTLRVNQRKTTPEVYLEELIRLGIPAKRIGRSAVLLENPVPVKKIPGFYEGLVSVQDAGTQLAAEILAPKSGERILDACAAPGGKTAHLLESADCQIEALEVDPLRAEMITQTLSRLGLKAKIRAADAALVNEWWSGTHFDAILLDAPCTASGIVRRQPDVPWSRRPSDPERLASEQKRLLDALWPCLKSSGRLLYCTCSIFPEEGREQIQRFLGNHPDAELGAFPGASDGIMSLIPTDNGSWHQGDALPSIHDGFFYALLRKR